jgi:hypothetical protein
VLFAGDLVENKCGVYAGDAYIRDWITTLKSVGSMPAEALVPGRGPAVTGREAVREAVEGTASFLQTLHDAVAGALPKGDADVAACYRAADAAMLPKFGHWPIFDHVLPFDTARMREELSGTQDPTIWTAERDAELWSALRG